MRMDSCSQRFIAPVLPYQLPTNYEYHRYGAPWARFLTMIGQAKNLITILASYYFWHTPFVLYNVLGISIAVIASFWYATAKVMESK